VVGQDLNEYIAVLFEKECVQQSFGESSECFVGGCKDGEGAFTESPWV